ncbi:hypothetical protein MUK42_33098 [Musa troglodytarum]|uniref:Uncharacterized protein n=1 Tax=Musa troglodytarum TaxID=320322 RepID=A0A9E7JSM1_9LILI|nr:hypothetical protein MUK42_33098 [Musa troglodytarum]
MSRCNCGSSGKKHLCCRRRPRLPNNAHTINEQKDVGLGHGRKLWRCPSWTSFTGQMGHFLSLRPRRSPNNSCLHSMERGSPELEQSTKKINFYLPLKHDDSLALALLVLLRDSQLVLSSSSSDARYDQQNKAIRRQHCKGGGARSPSSSAAPNCNKLHAFGVLMVLTENKSNPAALFVSAPPQAPAPLTNSSDLVVTEVCSSLL